MKTKLTLSFLLIAMVVRAQYFERSGYLSSQAVDGPARGLTPAQVNVDYKGNIFQLVGRDYCMGCQMEYSIGKSSPTGNSWSYTFPGYGVSPVANAFEDQNGNTYLVWKNDNSGYIGSLPYNVTGGYDYALVKFNGNTAQWVIDYPNGQKVYTDMADNLYVSYPNNFFRKYDASGALVDSSLFTQQTQPAFMDSLGGFYRYTTDTLVKFDFHGNILWQISFPFKYVDYSMQGAKIYTSNDTLIHAVDFNGNITAYPNLIGWTNVEFDCDGNYGGMSSKYNLNGNLMYSNSVQFNPMARDRTNRYYRWGYEDFEYVSTAVNYFVPPSIIRTIGPTDNIYWGEWFNWYQVFCNDTVDKTINFSFPYNQNFYCSGSSLQYTFNFSLNHYPPSLINSGFNLELSDSSGSFSAPLVLGTSARPPVKFFMPAGLPSSSNYKLRIVPNISDFSANNNVLPNITVRTTPSATITVTDALLSPFGTVQYCDSAHFFSQTNSFNAIYKWEKVTNLGNNQYQYQTLSTSPDFWYIIPNADGLKLTVTDSGSCSAFASTFAQKLYPVTNFNICYTDTVNPYAIHSIMLYTQYATGIDSIWGDNVYKTGNYFFFNADSAANGWNYFYRAIKQQYLFGTPPCVANDTIIDSVFVQPSLYATLSNFGPQTVCSGDSAVSQIIFQGGTAPIQYWIRDNANVRTGPYTATQSPHYHNHPALGNTFNLFIDSLADAQGAHPNSYSGYAGFTVINTYNPTVTLMGNSSFCIGDSVKLYRNNATSGYLVTWKNNGVIIPGTTGQVYYAKGAGKYSVEFNNQGCIKSSNKISLRTPCTNQISINNDKLFQEDEQYSLVKNEEEIKIQILPYIANNKLEVTANALFDVTGYKLYDLAGRCIYSNTSAFKNQQKYSLPVPVIYSGIYIAIISSNSTLHPQKVIKK